MKSLRTPLIALILGILAHTSVAQEGEATAPQPLEPVYFQQVRLDGFWRDQAQRLTQTWLPHCVRQMEPGGRGQELLNLINTAPALRGEPAAAFTGLPWSDAYVYNTIEAICLALAIDPADDQQWSDAQQHLRAKLDEWIPIVLAAQSPDGYIHSYHVLNKRPRYTNTGAHEFYVQGYLLEAGVAHYRITGGKDRRLFDAAVKCADHLVNTFGPPPKRLWIHGHPGMGYALCRLARLVEEVEGPGAGDRYVSVAKYLFDNRHRDEHPDAYRQSHEPVAEQSEAVGHAVRATYFYTAIADLAMLSGDSAFRQAADRLWDSAVNRKMYITGGVGSTGRGEAFSADFDLPNETAYCESCAGCGLSFWGDRMHRMHHDASYIDIAERVLFNNVLGAIELSGENFFYQNPLASEARRYPWHGCPCCVGNIPRALLAIKDLTYAVDVNRQTLYVNHFVAGEGTISRLAGTSLGIRQRTDYPWQGDVLLELQPHVPASFTLKLRIPQRDESQLYTSRPAPESRFTLSVNGQPYQAEVAHGYAAISRKWQTGDRVELALPMEIRRVYADQRVEADRGRVALARGPLVYNVEDADHDDHVRSIVLSPEASLQAVWRGDLLGGVMAIESESPPLTAIPNYARLNRGGSSLVWIPEDSSLAEPRPKPTIASTSKVSTSFQTDEGRFSMRAIHDQKEPEKSDERDTPLFHWWPHSGTKEWVAYEFRRHESVSEVEVYWYDDRGWGNCRNPEAWQLSYRDGDQWNPVEEASDYGVEPDRWNRVTFKPVTTDALRLEVQLRENHSAGILEWRVK